jgi:lipopolysaccharide/colanic/teichoic acid biosynthesis glycosyltransferase
MSIATDSATTSVQARERSLKQELLPRDVRAPDRFGTHRAIERRRVIVALTLLFSDIMSAFAALFLVDRLFDLPWTKTALIGLPILIGLFCVSGLYSGYALPPGERLRARLLGTLAFVGTFLVVPGSPFHTNVWFAAACQGALVFLLGHYAEALTRHALIRRKLWGAVTAFAGTGSAIEQAYQLLSATPELGLRPVGRIDAVEELASLDRHEIEVIVVATKADFARLSTASRIAACSPRILLLQARAQPTRSSLASGTISLAFGRNINARHNMLMKRAIDLTVGVPAMLIALPVIGVLALLIKLFSPGPAFYAQTRVGFKNRSFRVLKLRTMHCDAERLLEHYLHSNEAARLEWGRFCKLSRDPRILPYIGNVIRRMSLDELPQLWQVVRGDISLIGPRPFPTYHTDLFDPAFQKLRSSVPAGLTGFWQVSSRSNGDIDAQTAQDLYYIRNWSIWLDLYILLQTIPAVIGARGDR